MKDSIPEFDIQDPSASLVIEPLESMRAISTSRTMPMSDLQLRQFGYSEEEITWRTQALCRGMGETIFFPDRGYSMLPAYVICSGCPVRIECLESALEWGDDLGVRAGFTPYERDKIREKVAEGKSLRDAMEPWDKNRQGKLYRARARARAKQQAQALAEALEED